MSKKNIIRSTISLSKSGMAGHTRLSFVLRDHHKISKIVFNSTLYDILDRDICSLLILRTIPTQDSLQFLGKLDDTLAGVCGGCDQNMRSCSAIEIRGKLISLFVFKNLSFFSSVDHPVEGRERGWSVPRDHRVLQSYHRLPSPSPV